MSQKVKVLQFTVAATKGGRTLYVLNNWKKINKEHIQFDFITFSPQLDFEEELIDEGCKVFHISCYPENNREQFIKELDAVLDNGYDVIHIHTSFWKDTIVEERAKAKGVKKIIIHSHNSGCGIALSEEEARQAIELHEKVKERLTPEIATDFWACSEVAADWLFGDKIDRRNVKILKNAIDTKRFAYNYEDRINIRQEMRIKDELVLGHVGGFRYAKNHLFMLEILTQIVTYRPDTKLLLIGDGKLRDTIEEKVKALKIEKNILMLGNCATPEKYLQAMDIFLFPSLYEGFPLALVEAQTAGLKCLCSDRVSPEVLLTSNVEMLPLEENKWIEKITLLSQGYLREDKSKEIAEKGFDIYNQIKQIELEYMS